jgi:hypothetical protein
VLVVGLYDAEGVRVFVFFLVVGFLVVGGFRAFVVVGVLDASGF